MEKIITYFGNAMKVACDERCEKAFGIQLRPFIKLDDNNDDDIVFLSDDEVGIAPLDPGTYEGGDAKPVNRIDIPNKWCVRECERCVRTSYYEPITIKLELPNWNDRVFNIPSKH